VTSAAKLQAWTSPKFTAIAVAGLLAILLLQLGLSVRRLSATWDESCHIFAGYRYWKAGDYGMNPEHPPLVKLLASAPLLGLSLRVPEVRNRYFKVEEFIDGREFLFSNDADRIFFYSRMAVTILPLLLGFLIFAAGRELFGAAAGLIALAFFVFDPNFLAHGALVTTDVGVTCFLFAATYAYYRYKQRPTILRLLLVGLATGLAFAAKHSGILAVPILLALGGTEFAREVMKRKKLLIPFLKLLGEAIAVAAVSVAILWGFYGFRYAARPAGMPLNPTFSAALDRLESARDLEIIDALARHQLLPEAYLYGLTNILIFNDDLPTYLFEKVYRHGVWFYFPAVFIIKTTLPLLIMLPAASVALFRKRACCSRELIFLAVPPLLYFAQALTSGLNIGVRHILPVYPYLLLVVAGAAYSMLRRDRRWGYAIAALLLFHVASSLHAFPNYIAYSNEAWGGPSHTYRYLTDSNVDWGQQLKQVGDYLDRRGIKDCWFAYFAEFVVDRSYYGVPCKGLPTIGSRFGSEPAIPAEIDGVVLISASMLSGQGFLPSQPNPYADFQKIQPVAMIGDGVFVYEGHFDVPVASGLSHARLAESLLANDQVSQALAEARMAMELTPHSPEARAAISQALYRSTHPR
jgi:hypothetical protein